MNSVRGYALAAMLSLLLAACAGLDGGSGFAGDGAMSRPLSDTTPAAGAETRARVHVDLGSAYFEVGRYDVALDEARIALKESPDYPPAHHLLGLAYMLVGETAQARKGFEQALRQAPGDPEFNNSYGWFLCTQGEERRGLERLAAAARNPYYRYPTRSHVNAGWCHLRLGDDAAAQQSFMAALAADSANLEALYALAEIAYRAADYERAHALLIRVHQLGAPTPASVWLGLRTARRLGRADAESSYAAQLGSRFEGSDEYHKMKRGEFE